MLFWGVMKYLDFSTPKSVMKYIFFELFISVGVCVVGGEEREERRKWKCGF